ncbi:hypothetical protein COU37_00345 [Candidatus Micrarchaeota archaeon CG10_big_fil_rev_8_21_14_0_10_45_29]|nr:MAG: hypothetical protein COU37_00345 [Candidatus Micrarchaeota archaeon CG10_big_fil_rev_8_21_14_0_10_45_29]
MSEPLQTLERKFKETCKIVLGEPVGDLQEFLPWLSIHPGQISAKKSSVSGKQVVFTRMEYEGNRFISLDEVDFSKKYPKINPASMAGIVSLAKTLSDRFYYAGNLILGNSNFVESSTNISDCHYAYEAIQATNSKYIFKCNHGREDDSLFGVYGSGESSFCLSCSQLVRVKRSMETWVSNNSSDCYYCYGLDSCSNCIFCFHLKNRRYCVGNVQLEPEEYDRIKQRLLSEIRGILKKEKKIPSLVDVARKCRLSIPPLSQTRRDENSTEVTNKRRIENEFALTFLVLFGHAPESIDKYEQFLRRHVRLSQTCKSAASGKSIEMCTHALFRINLPPERILCMAEAEELGEKYDIGKDAAQTISMQNAHEKISKIAFFDADFWEGQNSNIIDCVVPVESSDCYKSVAMVYSKNCAYTFWPVNSSNCFGCDTIFHSSSCINCYHSVKLSRCFELDSCRDCSDSLFCHNIENCSNCLFCFNVKAKRYAIGNVEYPKEEYLKLKKKILMELSQKLEKDKNLDISIFNIGCKK